jgi:hypothetical protein
MTITSHGENKRASAVTTKSTLYSSYTTPCNQSTRFSSNSKQLSHVFSTIYERSSHSLLREGLDTPENSSQSNFKLSPPRPLFSASSSDLVEANRSRPAWFGPFRLSFSFSFLFIAAGVFVGIPNFVDIFPFEG